jgi:hypothetical protein
VEVRRLSQPDLDAYYALASEHGRVFYSSSWAEVFGARLQQYGVFDRNGKLLGGFHLIEQRRFGFRFLRNPPFTPVIGPFVLARSHNPVSLLEARRKVSEATAGFLAGQPRAIILVSLDHDVTDALAFDWAGFKTSPRYTYQIDLRRGLAEIVKDFSPTRRNDISKAVRDGLVVERADDLRVVGGLVRETFTRTHGRLDLTVLDAILERFGQPHNSYAFVTRREGRPIAAAFVIHDRTTAYYLLGGYDSGNGHHGAGALAIVEAIKAAKELGLQTFDFEGSSIPPIERFFRGFGGRLTHHFTVSRAWLPLEMALKFKKRNLF